MNSKAHVINFSINYEKGGDLIGKRSRKQDENVNRTHQRVHKILEEYAKFGGITDLNSVFMSSITVKIRKGKSFNQFDQKMRKVETEKI